MCASKKANDIKSYLKHASLNLNVGIWEVSETLKMSAKGSMILLKESEKNKDKSVLASRSRRISMADSF